MTTRNDAAPSALAEAARTTFIYAPILSVVGVALFAIGAVATVGFFTFMGVAVSLGAAVTGLVGVAGMIREGRSLLARQHEAAGLAIRYYQNSASQPRAGAAPGTVAVAAARQVPPSAVASPAASRAAEAHGAEGQGAEVEGIKVPTGGGPLPNSPDAAQFVALLKSLYILDAARDVQRLYGNFVCASFVNRKCAENEVSGVNLAGTDIPAQF